MNKTYSQRYKEFESTLFDAFEEIVKKGARFPTLCDVRYAHGETPEGVSIDNEGRAWFMASELKANPAYRLIETVGENDLIVEYNHVEFVDSNGRLHQIEPDVDDLRWCAEILDAAQGYYWNNGMQQKL